MNKRTSLIASIVFFALAALALVGIVTEANATPMKVVGTATIPSKIILSGILPLDDGTFTAFTFKSYSEQVLYIVERIEAKTIKGSGAMPAGYIMDASGFKHDCPTHGLETMSDGLIFVTDDVADALGVEIKLFPAPHTE